MVYLAVQCGVIQILTLSGQYAHTKTNVRLKPTETYLRGKLRS